MIKLFALLGIIAGSGAVGWLGVSEAAARRDKLKLLERELCRIGSLIADQGMMLPQAIRCAAHGSAATVDYAGLVQFLEKNISGVTEEQLLHCLKKSPGLADLKERELGVAAAYFRKLTECISVQEVRTAAADCREETERLLRELEEGELKRAKVFRAVWLLAGLCAAVILI